MENLWIVLVAIFILLDIPALYVVINEDLLYETHQKFFKVMFILCIPIIGAITELYLLSRYAHYKETGIGDDVKWYAFWDHYSNNSNSENGSSGSSSYDGGFDGGSGGGGE